MKEAINNPAGPDMRVHAMAAFEARPLAGKLFATYFM